ncbi:prealbumin-like fold domain-containing protein, partial [Mediterraneibacter glycyrrhizinilyticus]
EKTAPEGLVLNTETHEVELTYAGQEVSVTEADTAFYNERQKVTVDLTKTLEQDEIFGIGSAGEIQNVAFGLYAAEDLTAADGSVILADGLIEIVFCSTEGTAAFQTDLPFGKYYVKEVATDQHYLLSEETYPVDFTYQGQDTAVVHISANEGNAIENELIRGKISGRKVDTDGEALEGATIGLFSAGTEEFTEDTALMVTTSDEDGVFAFEDVPFGRWIVREIASLEGYVLNEALHYVSVLRCIKTTILRKTNLLRSAISKFLSMREAGRSCPRKKRRRFILLSGTPKCEKPWKTSQCPLWKGKSINEAKSESLAFEKWV